MEREARGLCPPHLKRKYFREGDDWADRAASESKRKEDGRAAIGEDHFRPPALDGPKLRHAKSKG
eukprot:2524636-Alexandrium_andersonii.AAC.1